MTREMLLSMGGFGLPSCFPITAEAVEGSVVAEHCSQPPHCDEHDALHIYLSGF